MPTIYGVDPSQPFTPIMIRDAISECFYQAHCEDSEIGGNEKLSRAYCSALVGKLFLDSGIEYDNPTKEDLSQAISALAAFASNFRSQETIKKHIREITALVNRLPN